MLYPIAIKLGRDTDAFGVIVPDLPGCFSAGDTFEYALANAREAIELHIEALLDAGETVPEPSDVGIYVGDPAYTGWIWAFVDIPIEALDDSTERINVTVPKRVLRIIDEAAQASGRSRSAYLAEAGLRRAREIHDAQAQVTAS